MYIYKGITGEKLMEHMLYENIPNIYLILKTDKAQISLENQDLLINCTGLGKMTLDLLIESSFCFSENMSLPLSPCQVQLHLHIQYRRVFYVKFVILIAVLIFPLGIWLKIQSFRNTKSLKVD